MTMYEIDDWLIAIPIEEIFFFLKFKNPEGKI